MVTVMYHIDDQVEDISEAVKLLAETEQFVKQLRQLADMNDNGEVNEMMKFAIDGIGYKLSCITFRSCSGSIVKLKCK